jgi:anaerobic selenocysteine-containing dehydrogenase
VQLAPAAPRGATARIPKVRKDAGLRPRDKGLLAVPVNKLYDRGLTVRPAGLLDLRVGEPTVSLHPDAAARLGLTEGARVTISFDGVRGEAQVKLDATISTGVALVPRSMGIPIHEPVPAKVK